MNKAVLMMLLASVCSRADAQWVSVSGDDIATAYADPATIRREADMVKMWDLLDFKAAQARPYGTPYLSQKAQHEFDCREERVRVIHLLRYSENMAGGEESDSDADAGEWKRVSTGSTNEKLLKLACEKH